MLRILDALVQSRRALGALGGKLDRGIEGFPRFRIGIGPKPENTDLAVWVLSGITGEEREKLMNSLNTIPKKIQVLLEQVNVQ